MQDFKKYAKLYFIIKAKPFPPVLQLKLEPSMIMHQEDPLPVELFLHLQQRVSP